MSILDLPDGIHPRIPAVEYHRPILGVASKSALDEFNRSPAHYRAWIRGERERSTPALAFGNALHCALLEPTVFAGRYAVEPDHGDCRFKDNKRARDEWRSANAGKELLDDGDMTTIRGMVASLMAHPLVRRMLEAGESELTALWTDQKSGLRCKTRTDFYQRSRGLACDIKTTEDAREKPFTRSIINYGYHRQDAMYRMGFGANGCPIQYFVLIAVEKAPPYAIATYQLDTTAIALGYASIRHDLDRLGECMRTDAWPAYDETIKTLELPPWAA